MQHIHLIIKSAWHILRIRERIYFGPNNILWLHRRTTNIYHQIDSKSQSWFQQYLSGIPRQTCIPSIKKKNSNLIIDKRISTGSSLGAVPTTILSPACHLQPRVLQNPK
jgi:hypothetical protein